MGAKGGRPRKYATGAERARAYRQRQRQARLAQAISVHFKHETTLWSTPQVLFDALDAEFHFTTDVCADASNAKCAHYFSPAQDGLRQRWEGTVWCNPPYGAEIPRSVQKAFEASLYGATVVCLLPARTDPGGGISTCCRSRRFAISPAASASGREATAPRSPVRWSSSDQPTMPQEAPHVHEVQ